MELNNQRVLVVGLGKSGVASALFLKAHGARVTVSDSKPEEQLGGDIPALLDQGIVVETGGHGERTFRGQDLIVVSPGVPVDSPPLVQARRAGEEVIGEIELAAQFLQGEIVAITGSNGKTTTTSLIGEILAAGGFPTLVGGNIGMPAIALVEKTTPQTLTVLEVSSFQLETIRTFRPQVAVILNITPDHLDRHHTFESYVNAKARIFENQRVNDFTVLNADDATCVQLAGRTQAQVFWFSRHKKVENGAYVQDGKLCFRRGGEAEQEIMPVAEIPLKGAHNVENVLASACAGLLLGCPAEKIRKAVRVFKAVEHRLEFVATVRGVEYYNDSKATNVDATIKALESFPKNIHLILGGKDKGSDYRVLNPLLRERVKRVYTIGAAAAKIESQIQGAEIVPAATLEAAVKKAAAVAEPGDIVLLAPACASFDQFQSYEHRGRVFKEAVRALTPV
ncbi:MAG: UDP-N-acetylmuramoyl-L-alanine--D-glutamate ligase [Acidobacteria bacterium]|nr:UDP-N-acetylmuramoyl-L-alanine--D-glutamate ligase [Acidobacteriota bacterium]